MCLFPSSQVKDKKENQREHQSPIAVPKSYCHYLVYADDDESGCQRKENYIRKFHEV